MISPARRTPGGSFLPIMLKYWLGFNKVPGVGAKKRVEETPKSAIVLSGRNISDRMTDKRRINCRLKTLGIPISNMAINAP